MSDSNPWRGTDSSTGAGGRLGALRAVLEDRALVAVFTKGVRAAPVLLGAFTGSRLELAVPAVTLPGVAGLELVACALRRGAVVFALAAGVALAFALALGFATASRVPRAGAEALALRAAVLRAVDRCGRVRGRLARTPTPASGPLGRPLLSFGALTSTSLLKAARCNQIEELAANRAPWLSHCSGDALAWEP
jgi:hypothetical protein